MLQDPLGQGYVPHQLLLLHEHLVLAYPPKQKKNIRVNVDLQVEMNFN